MECNDGRKGRGSSSREASNIFRGKGGAGMRITEVKSFRCRTTRN